MNRNIVRGMVCVLVGMCCPWVTHVRADPGVITIAEPSHANQATLGSLNPPLSVSVRHSAGKAMGITFRTDASGRWEDIARKKAT